MGTQPAEPKTVQENLSSYFDGIAAAVRQTFARFENSCILPVLDLLRVLFLAYPIPFVFFSIFFTLAFFPILAYIVVSLATLSAALSIALCLAFVFSSGVFFLSGGVLLATLGFTLLLSAFLTTFSISAYLSGRLILNLRRSGRHGFRVWSQEVTHLFFPSSAHLIPVHDDQSASEGSDIWVGPDTRDGRTTKMEPLPSGTPDSPSKHVT
ncbi:hypothetical protein BC827DRAFT_1267123 [Russula dissimulans]|nr:hypothetical protein BC827DRAFT_1267123 [Russula dissimulans]